VERTGRGHSRNYTANDDRCWPIGKDKRVLIEGKVIGKIDMHVELEQRIKESRV
jgi:hypothetical protein